MPNSAEKYATGMAPSTPASRAPHVVRVLFKYSLSRRCAWLIRVYSTISEARSATCSGVISASKAIGLWSICRQRTGSRSRKRFTTSGCQLHHKLRASAINLSYKSAAVISVQLARTTLAAELGISVELIGGDSFVPVAGAPNAETLA